MPGESKGNAAKTLDLIADDGTLHRKSFAEIASHYAARQISLRREFLTRLDPARRAEILQRNDAATIEEDADKMYDCDYSLMLATTRGEKRRAHFLAIGVATRRARLVATRKSRKYRRKTKERSRGEKKTMERLEQKHRQTPGEPLVMAEEIGSGRIKLCFLDPMGADAIEEKRAYLECTVPLLILECASRGGPDDYQREQVRAMSELLGIHGVSLLFPAPKEVTKPDRSITPALFAQCIALLAFSPGGIDIFGAHFEAADWGAWIPQKKETSFMSDYNRSSPEAARQSIEQLCQRIHNEGVQEKLSPAWMAQDRRLLDIEQRLLYAVLPLLPTDVCDTIDRALDYHAWLLLQPEQKTREDDAV